MSGNLGEVVPFMRSGGLGSSTHQLLAWAGDQNVNWEFGDGLPSTIIAGEFNVVSFFYLVKTHSCALEFLYIWSDFGKHVTTFH